MLGTSRRIIARLIRAPGEPSSRGLRDGIISNTQAISNLTRILEEDKFGPVLKMAAIDVLAELASSSDKSATTLGKPDIKKFISQLWGIFLAEADDENTIEEEEQRKQASRLRQKAGEALAQMLSVSVWDAAASSSDSILEMFILQSTNYPEEVRTAELHHVVGLLTDMLIKSKVTQTSAARILECLCSHVTKHKELPRQDVIQMLRKVSTPSLAPGFTKKKGILSSSNDGAYICMSTDLCRFYKSYHVSQGKQTIAGG